MRRLPTTAAALLTILAAPIAAAPPAGATLPGPITRAQMQQFCRELFDALDSNGDGVLDQAEQKFALERLEAHGISSAGLRKEFADASAPDGRVRFQSLLTVRMRNFDAADTNRDGVLDPAENAAAQAQR